MKIFVINLDRDVQKYNDIQLAFKNYNLERFSGYLGKNYRNHPDVSPGAKLFATDSMIGIGLSHFNLWKKIVNEGISQALILEDDVKPTGDFDKELVNTLKTLPDDYDICYLKCLTPFMTHYRDRLHSVNSALYTQGYLLSINGAKKLLKEISGIKFHIDFQVCMCLSKLNAYTVHPFILETDYTDSSNSTPPLFLRYLPDEFQWFMGLNWVQIPIVNIKISIWKSLIILLLLISLYKNYSNYLLVVLLLILYF